MKAQSALKEVFPISIVFGIAGGLVFIFLKLISNKGFIEIVPWPLAVIGALYAFLYWKKNSELNFKKSFYIGFIVSLIFCLFTVAKVFINRNFKSGIFVAKIDDIIFILIPVGFALLIGLIAGLFFFSEKRDRPSFSVSIKEIIPGSILCGLAGTLFMILISFFIYKTLNSLLILPFIYLLTMLVFVRWKKNFQTNYLKAAVIGVMVMFTTGFCYYNYFKVVIEPDVFPLSRITLKGEIEAIVFLISIAIGFSSILALFFRGRKILN